MSTNQMPSAQEITFPSKPYRIMASTINYPKPFLVGDYRWQWHATIVCWWWRNIGWDAELTLLSNITFPLHDRNAKNIGGKPYVATVSLSPGHNQASVLLAGNDNRADLRVVAEISHGIPAIHLSDAYAAQNALTVRASRNHLHICPNDAGATMANNDSADYNYRKPFAVFLPASKQINRFAGRYSRHFASAHATTIAPHEDRLLHAIIRDDDNPMVTPYTVSISIHAQIIEVNIISLDDRSNLSAIIEINKGVPAIHFSADSIAETALHVHATKAGLYLCPEADQEMQRDFTQGINGGKNALRVPLNRASHGDADNPRM